MKYDKYGVLVSEILSEGEVGNVGDSCANTCRKTLMETSSKELQALVKAFNDGENYRRHPECPWPKEEFSWDQALPLFMVFHKHWLLDELKTFLVRLTNNRYRLNGGPYPSLLFVSVFKRVMGSRSSFWDLPILMQALVFRFVPWRWSDATMRFESSAGSTADYVNYAHVLLLCHEQSHTLASWLALKLTPKELLMDKIRKYYKENERPEPNVDWLLDLYEKSLKVL